jgi:hypothetical protein
MSVVLLARGLQLVRLRGPPSVPPKGTMIPNARREIINDLREKSLQNVPVGPQSIASGFLFFPGEAGSAGQLRLQLKEKETENIHVLNLIF